MDSQEWTERFEQHRPRLRAIAYRMLGSTSSADDVVQESWLRLRRVDAGEIENLGGWLTTVVTRLCLNAMRTRRRQREEPFEAHVPDPVIDRPGAMQPEHEALLADAVGMALMTVLQTLTPPERIALVLHDSFAVPFEEIAPILEKSPAATRQLASRARRKVQTTPTTLEPDVARQRHVVDAFFESARSGDLEGLVAVLDPDVVLRADTGDRATSRFVRGASAVATNALLFSRPSAILRPALVNGTAGVVVVEGPDVVAVMAFTVADGRIATIDVLNDSTRLGQLDLAVLDG